MKFDRVAGPTPNLPRLTVYVICSLILMLSCMVGCSTRKPHEGPFTQQELDAALAVLDRHEEGLQQIPGVMGWGVGIETPESTSLVIQVYLEHDDPEVRNLIPQEMEGIPVKTLVSGGSTMY